MQRHSNAVPKCNLSAQSGSSRVKGLPGTSNFTPKNIHPSTARSQLSLKNKSCVEQAGARGEREAVASNNQGNVYIFNIQLT